MREGSYSSVKVALLLLLLAISIAVCGKKSTPVVESQPEKLDRQVEEEVEPLYDRFLRDENRFKDFPIESRHRYALLSRYNQFFLWDSETASLLFYSNKARDRIGWATLSQDETRLVCGNYLPDIIESREFPDWESTPRTITCWDCVNGGLQFRIPLTTWGTDARGGRLEWYPVWLNRSELLLVCSWKYNRSRETEITELFSIDTISGKVKKSSGRLRYVGERIYVSPDRKRAVILSAGSEKNRLYTDSKTTLIDFESFQVISSWSDPGTDPKSNWAVNARMACWTPDSKYLITSNDEGVYRVLLPKIHVWDANSGRLLKSLLAGNSWIQSIQCASDGERLFVGTEDGNIQIWSISEGKLIDQFFAVRGGLESLQLSPNDEFLLCVGQESEAAVIEVRSRTQRLAFNDPDSKIVSARFPEPNTLQFDTSRNATETWDLKTGRRTSRREFGELDSLAILWEADCLIARKKK